ncbi:MAG: Zn-dependent exopeptidase M28 [Acidobacteria bacterium]|nr:Zn-dependent exopeptidase M28 [Acidobacteriota bacterium]MBU4307304.1 Zn-dependent exopeptidase M28 [Acidobacteriota bacterium]MBU4405887.1 Zn-dependent exopeptidase M28 [Acidobacteriota bacterium]MCG2811311.1 M28 family metallopeptidase [Candidatus Aminicenantes bacterium]
MKKTYDQYVEAAWQMTADIIDKHGPRVSGTEGCYSACTELEAILGKYCQSVKRESFWIHPASLFAIGKIFTVIYLIGMIAILIESKISMGIGLICMISGTIYFFIQFILYADTFDGLFKRVAGNNIIGIIEPQAAVKQQVVIVSHHDSSPVYPFYEKVPFLFPIRLFAPILLFILCLLLLFIGFCFRVPIGSMPLLPIWLKYILFFGIIFVVPMYGYISKRQSPGAGDNLIGCAIVIKLAEIFQSVENVLQNTRIVVLLTDGEEVGQKGAKFFIKNNRELLGTAKTIVINVDSIYEYENIALLKRDRNGFTRLSKDLVNDVKMVAMELGHALKTISIPFGGGGTDGGQFARQKIKTVSIIGMPTNMFRKEIVFHTMKDRPEKISKKAVRTVIEVVSEYIKKIEICNEGIRGRPYPNEILGDQPVIPTLCPPAPVPTLSPYRSMPGPDGLRDSSTGNS